LPANALVIPLICNAGLVIISKSSHTILGIP